MDENLKFEDKEYKISAEKYDYVMRKLGLISQEKETLLEIYNKLKAKNLLFEEFLTYISKE